MRGGGKNNPNYDKYDISIRKPAIFLFLPGVSWGGFLFILFSFSLFSLLDLRPALSGCAGCIYPEVRARISPFIFCWIRSLKIAKDHSIRKRGKRMYPLDRTMSLGICLNIPFGNRDNPHRIVPDWYCLNFFPDAGNLTGMLKEATGLSPRCGSRTSPVCSKNRLGSLPDA